MHVGIGKILYESIIENKWVDVTYANEKGNTYFWLAIDDIKLNRQTNEKSLVCKIVNYRANYNTVIVAEKIDPEKIISAKLIIGTYYKCKDKLLDDIVSFPNHYDWLDIQSYDNNILLYINECHKNDNDPYIEESHYINGLQYKDFVNNEAKLSTEIMTKLLELIFKVNDIDQIEEKTQIAIGLNTLAVSINNKKYVIAYKEITIDLVRKVAVLSSKSTINPSFLIEGKRCSLFDYIQCDPEYFVKDFDNHPNEYFRLIQNNLNKNEFIDTREEIFILKRHYNCNLIALANSIIQMQETQSLTRPLKAFFGKNISKRKAKNKEPYIVIKNKNINPDQLRVIYNVMTNYITYVDGPPGTGKTHTILNVILSAMANNQTCIISSNNNKPIDDIYQSLTFSYQGENILFPMIRLGNKTVNEKAIDYIKSLYEIIKNIDERSLSEKEIEEYKKINLAPYEQLRQLLDENESKQEIIEKIESLNKINKYIDKEKLSGYFKEELLKYQKELINYEKDKTNEMLELVVPIENNESYLRYLKYNSINCLKKLTDKSNSELIEIILTEDKKKAIRLFNQYIGIEENLKKLIAIFPIIFTTNISSGHIGPNKPIFDLCIIDEASQCNIATSLNPIVRAKSLLLVGDEKQLKPVIVLEENLNKKLMVKYNISNEYNYLEKSIFTLMRSKDITSKHITLRYHYRCPKKIIEFCNKNFYDNKLIPSCESNSYFEFYNVHNNKGNRANEYEEEANAIVDILIKNNYKDAFVITPFRNQAELINEKLKKKNKDDIVAGTIHTVQGSEKKTIIMSLGISKYTYTKSFEWVKNNEQLINVGFSRSKQDVILVGDYEAIKIHDKGENSIISQLTDYVKNNGNITNIKPLPKIVNNLSNNSEAEKELYKTLIPFFDVNYELIIERNQPVHKVLGIPEEKYIDYYYKAEFDCLISKKNMIGKRQPVLVIELDGAEHSNSKKTFKRDRMKEIICNTQKIDIIRVPNFLCKDYVTLIYLIAARIECNKPKTYLQFED